MKKALYTLFNIVIPVAVGYTVFGILLSLFSKIPEVGLTVAKAWYLPFIALTIYMTYEVIKDFRLVKD